MQQSLVGNLSNVIVRNHAKVDVLTVASKNYSIQNYATVQVSANITIQTYA